MINTTPITQLIQQIRSAELSSDKEIKLPMAKARLLALALAEVMDKLNQDYESILNEIKSNGSGGGDTLSVEMDGGGFDTK